MGLLIASTLQDIARIWVNELTNTNYLKSLEVCFGYLYHHKALQTWVLLEFLKMLIFFGNLTLARGSLTGRGQTAPTGDVATSRPEKRLLHSGGRKSITEKRTGRKIL